MERIPEALLEGGPSSGITQKQWAEILRSIPKPVVDNNTTPHMAGFLLGIQYTLDRIRPLVRS
jgi:hypothetical protein